MVNTGLSESDIAQIKQAIAQYSDINEVYIFGSRAKGTYKKGSDIDLAIKFSGPEHTPIQLIHDTLEEEIPLPYFFDVIDYDTIQNKELIEHIDRVGKPISTL
jgi:predicted nucleotidyltransferase